MEMRRDGRCERREEKKRERERQRDRDRERIMLPLYQQQENQNMYHPLTVAQFLLSQQQEFYPLDAALLVRDAIQQYINTTIRQYSKKQRPSTLDDNTNARFFFF